MIAARTDSAWNPNHGRCHSMIRQGAAQSSSSPSAPAQPPSTQRPGGDAVVPALSCPSFDSILSPPLPASSSPAEPRRAPSAKAPHPSEVLRCPRCDSLDTKFCYYNNYSLTQPRYFCKNCKRYWTAGGALRNVPVGGGLRKNKRSKLKLAAVAAEAEAALAGSAGGKTKAAEEASLNNDNRTMATALPHNVAMPSHLLVGVSEVGMYTHAGGISYPAKSHIGGDGLTNSAAPQYIAEHMVDQNQTISCTSASTLHQQAGINVLSKDEANAGADHYRDSVHIPQLYSSYPASLPIQFAAGNAGMPGYTMNHNCFQADPSGSASTEDAVSGSMAMPFPVHSGGDTKQEKDKVSSNAFDWQLMSDGIFNGGGATESTFLYTPSSTWPDFSQFNDSGHG